LPSSSLLGLSSLILFPLFATGVIDTGGTLAAGIVDTGVKFAIGINNTSETRGKICRQVVDTSGKFAAGVIDTGAAPSLANISANFRKNSKRF
jgi:hypothetical protein